MTTALAPTDSRLKAFRGELAAQFKGLSALLPEGFTPERFARMSLNAVQAVPKLLECDRGSLFLALNNCAALGLEPNTALHEAAIVPRAGTAMLQLEYRAYVKLASNAGVGLQWGTIYAGDKVEYRYGSEALFRLSPKPPWEREGAVVVGYYAYALTPGGPVFLVWSKQEVEAHRDRYSDAYKRAEANGKKDSAWHTAPDRMGEKTLVHQLSRWLPKEVQRLSRVEQAIDMGYRVQPAEGGEIDIVDATSEPVIDLPVEPPPDPRAQRADERLANKREEVKSRASDGADLPTAYRVGYRQSDNAILRRGTDDEWVPITTEPLRTNTGKSKTRFACAWCDQEIVKGEQYYDGKKGCKAHVHCVEEEPDGAEEGGEPPSVEEALEEEAFPAEGETVAEPPPAQEAMPSSAPKPTLTADEISALLVIARSPTGLGETAFLEKVKQIYANYSALDQVPREKFPALLDLASGA